MPVARRVANAFTAQELSAISGVSMPMVNYLRREGILVPAYEDAGAGRRGKVRYYSYRDLIIARLLQALRTAGIELFAIRAAVSRLREDGIWDGAHETVPAALRFLHTDGRTVYLRRSNGTLEPTGKNRQLAFEFVVHVDKISAQMRALIPSDRQKAFSFKNEPIRFIA